MAGGAIKAMDVIHLVAELLEEAGAVWEGDGGNNCAGPEAYVELVLYCSRWALFCSMLSNIARC